MNGMLQNGSPSQAVVPTRRDQPAIADNAAARLCALSVVRVISLKGGSERAGSRRGVHDAPDEAVKRNISELR